MLVAVGAGLASSVVCWMALVSSVVAMGTVLTVPSPLRGIRRATGAVEDEVIRLYTDAGGDEDGVLRRSRRR